MKRLPIDTTTARTVAAVIAIVATMASLGGPISLAQHYASAAPTVAAAPSIDNSHLASRVVITAQRVS